MTAAAPAVEGRRCSRCGGAGPFYADPKSRKCKACKVAQVMGSQQDHKPAYLRRRQAVTATVRARKAGARGTISAAEWAGLLEAFGHACGWCGEKGAALELEHVYPLSRGGPNDASNIMPACSGCNGAKGAMLPLTFFFCLDLPF